MTANIKINKSNNKIMFPKSKLKKLRNDLKGQPMDSVIEKTGKSKAAIYDVLKNKYYNASIIEACIELRDKIRSEKQELADRI